MRAKNKMRQFSSLLNEHWKRKQRLKRTKIKTIETSLHRAVEGYYLSKKVIDVFRVTTNSFLDGPKARAVSGGPKKVKNQRNCRSSSEPTLVASSEANNYADAKKVPTSLIVGRWPLVAIFGVALYLNAAVVAASAQSMIPQSDPRPTIYSGQVSFGLLLSAHSTLGTELSTSASQQVVVNSILAMDASVPAPLSSSVQQESLNKSSSAIIGATTNQSLELPSPSSAGEETGEAYLDHGQESQSYSLYKQLPRHHDKRQIFERVNNQHRRQQQLQLQQQQLLQKYNQPAATDPNGLCSQVNANALYAGMGAIWASHQANLVGDSHLAIGTYVYDSCNDLDVGQRQSVRIVSNLNAFQQTTCESPRGSPISLTIAHGDNQLRAIQLLTSFKVPVITTKENFALEDYQQLSHDQRRFLFSTAPSSRHLAVGALRFSKRIVSRSTSSPKLPNQFHKMSSKNGLIVISRNLPQKFITYLTETIPLHVNYEMLQSNQPIDQIKSVDALESILIKSGGLDSAGSSSSESKLYKTVAKAPEFYQDLDTSSKRKRRRRRNPDSDGDSSSDDSSDESPSKMLSPTILMFITPSEAIDLVTRLRNDLAEVSRYYSLIVSTREDISPALKTIFHRGGSRLCSGKAFYTISPKPDDIGEFSRYFRDTVQMEGENSDHPLICEFAKYQSMSKISADLDDISTEPVIKAVWTAAAAFKSVYRRECSSQAGGPQQATSTGNPKATNVYRAGGGPGDSTADSVQANSRHSRQPSSGSSSRSECMVKMHKNMSNLVQRALKRLDVTINSTGLQALDGFRIKFDDMNELMTNKFSIKYINKECEITELGHFSGFKDSSLRIDEETLVKSLESTLPDPWPVTVTPSSTPAPALLNTNQVTGGASASSGSGADSSAAAGSVDAPAKEASESGSDAGGSPGDSSSSTGEQQSPKSRGRRKNKSSDSSNDGDSRGSNNESGGGGDEGDPSDGDKLSDASDEIPQKRQQRKRSKTPNGSETLSDSSRNRMNGRRKQTTNSRPVTSPVTALNGRDILPGMTDTTEQSITTNEPSNMRQQQQQRRLKSFPTNAPGITLRDWLPTTGNLAPNANRVTLETLSLNPASTRTPNVLSGLVQGGSKGFNLHADNEQVDPTTSDLKSKATTQAPVYSTLPESDGNADLEPTVRVPKSISTGQQGNKPNQTTAPPRSSRQSMDTAATTNVLTDHDGADYVTSPSISKNLLLSTMPANPQQTLGRLGFSPNNQLSSNNNQTSNRLNFYKDLHSSPIPLSSVAKSYRGSYSDSISGDEQAKNNRHKLRSHLKWIYSSWFTLTILCANICGALLTLYVLTFLLMKNCDGSLDRQNQGLRSLHLLSIIVVFFGSTLFIVYPTPGLCLLRASWHNFALVMLIGTLLLQTMQTRSIKSIGLGGRPNKLNQFLTLVFMVGVQVSFELQRWKYESINYMNFVTQYFGPLSSTSGEDDKKLLMLSNTLANQLNPLNSFNVEQFTPVSIELSESYQNLLQDYCLQQQGDDFLQSQIYLCFLVFLLLVFSLTTRNYEQQTKLLNTTTATGKKKRGQSMNSAENFQFSPANLMAASHQMGKSSTDVGQACLFENSNMFTLALMIVPIYAISIIFHLYGQSTTFNRDLISSITMVLIAFVTLLGVFLPILIRIHRFDRLVSKRHGATGSLTQPVSMMQQSPTDQITDHRQHHSSPFAMFPEFAPTGLRRPSSNSGDSSGGSRRPFAETKESRRNMSAALANLGPSEDSLKSMGFYNAATATATTTNLDMGTSPLAHQKLIKTVDHQHGGKSEKRLIMLDVDPCCPRHGVTAWQATGSKTTETESSVSSSASSRANITKSKQVHSSKMAAGKSAHSQL